VSSGGAAVGTLARLSRESVYASVRASVAELALGGERGVIGMGGVVGRQRLVADIIQGRGGGGRSQNGRLVGISGGRVRGRCSVLVILVLLGGLAGVLAPREL
jgi:hypothetical protein